MMFEPLKDAASRLGKPEWRKLLGYVAELHERSTHAAKEPFPYPWEEIGPGYHFAPAFGHWDITHIILDTMAHAPVHAQHQILNNLAAQQEDGHVPGVISWDASTGAPKWNPNMGHPPVWPFAVNDYVKQTGEYGFLDRCLEPLLRLINWYESNRKSVDGGYYYLDITQGQFESGIDQGIRFQGVERGPYSCIDATSHVYALYESAADWSEYLGRPGESYRTRAAAIGAYIRDELYNDDTGLFHDIWAMERPELRCLAFEGMWPIVVGAASVDQATRVIDDNLLNEKRFFAPHPIASVALCDPLFELRMWRGPSWNSMTYWAARGCMRYGRHDAAKMLLERALDMTAEEHGRSGTIYEFYHPFGGDPMSLQRKPNQHINTPSRDYLGHNPLIAMAILWETLLENDALKSD